MTCQQPTVDLAKCTGCGACVPACPCGAIALHDGIPVFSCGDACLHDKSCVALVRCCWPCEDACPHDAIRCAFLIETD